jgi:DNA-binding transcriptional regulator YhcF (GntR family)
MGDGLTIRFDPASGVPAIRQIADNLRVLLVENKLAKGDALPPVRRLAMELGVHFNTVAEAYRQLAAEGWLDLQHGRGATVIARSTPRIVTDWLEQFRDQLRVLIAQMRAKGAAADEIAAELRAAARVVTRS